MVYVQAINMATAVSRILKNTFLENKSILRCFAAHHLQNSKLSTQTQPNIDHEESEVRLGPLQHPDYFQVHKLFTLKDLFDARVHFGHKDGTLNDHMKPFIYGTRLGHCIIDLNQTAELLRQALNFTAHIAFNSGIILFISRNPQITHLVEKTAKECGEFSQARRWNRGTFTNSINEFGAITRLPDLCIVLNTLNTVMLEHSAIISSAKMAIPTVGIVDSNCDPRFITYPVPGNDDSLSSLELYCNLFKTAVLLGKEAKNSLNTKT